MSIALGIFATQTVFCAISINLLVTSTTFHICSEAKVVISWVGLVVTENTIDCRRFVIEKRLEKNYLFSTKTNTVNDNDRAHSRRLSKNARKASLPKKSSCRRWSNLARCFPWTCKPIIKNVQIWTPNNTRPIFHESFIQCAKTNFGIRDCGKLKMR